MLNVTSNKCFKFFINFSKFYFWEIEQIEQKRLRQNIHVITSNSEYYTDNRFENFIKKSTIANIIVINEDEVLVEMNRMSVYLVYSYGNCMLRTE